MYEKLKITPKMRSVLLSWGKSPWSKQLWNSWWFYFSHVVHSLSISMCFSSHFIRTSVLNYQNKAQYYPGWDCSLPVLSVSLCFGTYNTSPMQSGMHLAYQTDDNEPFLHRHKGIKFSISFQSTLFPFPKIRMPQTELYFFNCNWY